jgi:hypothetical protein
VPPFSSQNTATPSWFRCVQRDLGRCKKPTLGGEADFVWIYGHFGSDPRDDRTAILTKISCTGAFSSEVETGSRKENASKQKDWSPVLIQSEPNRLQTSRETKIKRTLVPEIA